MPNGKPGDHPLTDILIHDRKIYSPVARDLIREIAALADEDSSRTGRSAPDKVQRILQA